MTLCLQTFARIGSTRQTPLSCRVLFSLAAMEIERSGWEGALSSGVVLTGGGAALEGLVEVAEQVFDLPVRIGGPVGVGGLVDLVAAPANATAVGILLYGAAHQQRRETMRVPAYLLDRVSSRVKGFFTDIFGTAK